MNNYLYMRVHVRVHIALLHRMNLLHMRLHIHLHIRMPKNDLKWLFLMLLYYNYRMDNE